MKIIDFKEIPNEKWDEYVAMLPDATHLHTSWRLNYFNAIGGTEYDRSFAVLEGEIPLALCPLTVSQGVFAGKKFIEAAAASCYPAIIRLPSAQRRRTVRAIFNLIDERLNKDDVKRAVLYKHPVSLGFLQGDTEPSNIAEAVSYGYFCHVRNTIIVDLRKDEAALIADMSKYHRKHIKKTAKQGVVIKEYRGDVDVLQSLFTEFRNAHFKSAGRWTRPMASWDVMESLLKRNMATLFVASLETGLNISFLFCGEFDKFSFGWSQVNIDEYESEYSPRHMLEWEAMMSYKRRGFSFYGLGFKYDMPLLDYIPTEKEITISQLKERFGGKLYCALHFEKFFDRDLFSQFYSGRIESLRSSDALFGCSGNKGGDEHE